MVFLLYQHIGNTLALISLMTNMPIPDFFCLGAQKAGTTTLHNILKQHPDIFLPERKEPSFFEVDEDYAKGLDYYFSEYFKSFKGEQYVGNINPNLQLSNVAIDRIVQDFGTEIKMIFIMRDPVDRAYSHYLMSKRRGYETLSFVDALSTENDRIAHPGEYSEYYYQTKEPGFFEKNHFGYAYRSRYLRTLEYLYKKLPEKCIKIIHFDRFISNKKGVINEILNFLGLKGTDNLKIDLHSNTAATPISSTLRNLIYLPNTFKTLLKKVLPESVRTSLKEKMIKLNNRPLSKKEKTLSKEEAKYVFDKYFSEEVAGIEDFLKTSLSKWKR